MAYCYIADSLGHGALSETGWFFYPATEVMVESDSAYAPPGQQAAVNVVFVEGDIPSGNYAIFTGSGTFGGAVGK